MTTVLLLTLAWILWVAFTGLRPVPPAGRTVPLRNASERERAIVERWFPYYQHLEPPDRERFLRICATFLHAKRWTGVGIELVEEMRVMIAASAAQLLFGLPDLTLVHFRHIVVHPDAYRDDRSKRYHQGEVMPRHGVIKVSWKHFLHGYADPADAHNVALHEMAHALWFEEIIPSAEDEFLDAQALQEWRRMAPVEIERIRAGRSRLFRTYAGTDQEEFFAVAVEYFFEQPLAFREAMPELYAVMVRLLKQDTARCWERRSRPVLAHA